jgi:hypothetical protein
MRIIALRAAGFIGSHLTHRLLAEGHYLPQQPEDIPRVFSFFVAEERERNPRGAGAAC